MDTEAFKRSAKFIVGRNVSDHVQAVFVGFNPEKGALRLVYCTAGMPAEEDEDDCELACAELVAHFPEIRTAETQCIRVADYAAPQGMKEIFSRR